MAHTCREFPVPPAAVWDLLIDPYTYPEWLVGTAEIRDVDDDWPAVGSRFRHRVGIGPLTIPDHSEVLHIEPRRELRLAVRARPFVSAVATFRLVGDRTVSMLSLQEEPTVRTVGNLVRPVIDPSIHLRNHRSLRRLGDLIERNRAG
ncbi:MAG TPA: SRPBCC family protein [Ilumatobacteraceae bacterium]|nr:SRPBCC family protein [Ilumatobacteraceae bacterium]